jgi:putative transposase
MEVETTHIQNEKPKFAAHAGRGSPLWCRWRRLRAVHPRAQDALAEYSRPFGKSDPHRRCVVRSLPAIPRERQVMNSSPLSFVRQSIESVYQAAQQRLCRWAKPDDHDPVLNAAMDLTCTKSELPLENMLLRQQLIVLKRQAKRPALTWRDRTLFVLLANRWRTWKQALVIVQPETVLRWHRDLFRWVWRRKSRLQRRGKPQWAIFLRNHAREIWACDFLQTDDVLFRTPFIFVIIELGSRRLVHFGVTRNPTGAWVAQRLREATPCSQGPRYLIRDNDRKYGRLFARIDSGTSIEVLRTPTERRRQT